MSLTQAIEEAYASNPAGEVIIETIELDHVTFDEPVRVASGVEKEIALPLALGGTPVLFKAIPLSAVLPGVTEDGPTPMRLRINDVLGALTEYLDLAVQATEPIKVTYRAYTTTDLTQPGDVMTGLFLREVAQDATGAEGTVTFREIAMQNFPLLTYDQALFPTLQQG